MRRSTGALQTCAAALLVIGLLVDTATAVDDVADVNVGVTGCPRYSFEYNPLGMNHRKGESLLVNINPSKGSQINSVHISIKTGEFEPTATGLITQIGQEGPIWYIDLLISNHTAKYFFLPDMINEISVGMNFIDSNPDGGHERRPLKIKMLTFHHSTVKRC